MVSMIGWDGLSWERLTRWLSRELVINHPRLRSLIGPVSHG